MLINTFLMDLKQKRETREVSREPSANLITQRVPETKEERETEKYFLITQLCSNIILLPESVFETQEEREFMKDLCSKNGILNCKGIVLDTCYVPWQMNYYFQLLFFGKICLGSSKRGIRNADRLPFITWQKERNLPLITLGGGGFNLDGFKNEKKLGRGLRDDERTLKNFGSGVYVIGTIHVQHYSA